MCWVIVEDNTKLTSDESFHARGPATVNDLSRSLVFCCGCRTTQEHWSVDRRDLHQEMPQADSHQQDSLWCWARHHMICIVYDRLKLLTCSERIDGLLTSAAYEAWQLHAWINEAYSTAAALWTDCNLHQHCVAVVEPAWNDCIYYWFGSFIRQWVHHNKA